MQQYMLNFESAELPTKEVNKVQEDVSLPPPPQGEREQPRILHYPGKLHFDWPEASNQHDRDTITVDRVGTVNGQVPHRFVILRGDTVRVNLTKDKQKDGEVVGISHARNEVSIRFPGARAGTDGIWFSLGYIYPSKQPIEEPPKGVPLSGVIERLNSKHGETLTEADRVPAQATPYLFADHKQTVEKLRDGSITVAEIQDGFTRLLESKDAFVADLVGRLKAPQLKALASRLGDWNAKSQRKEENAASIHRMLLHDFHLADSFSYVMGQDPEQVLRDAVFGQTKADIEAYFAKRNDAKEETEKAVSNPETLSEFHTFLRHLGEAELSDSQLRTFSELNASISRKRRAEKRQEQSVSQFESEELSDIAFTVKEGYHDKKECSLWIVQLPGRVERATFTELKNKAKMLGGWYSSFKKADAGFQFLDKERAERFTALLGSDVDRTDVLEQRKERRELTAAERLHELAKSTFDKAEETIEASENSLQNTVRRADMQAGIRGRAHADQALARSLHSIAEALSTGEAKFLDGIRFKVQIEELDSILYLAKYARIREVKKLENEGSYNHHKRQETESDKPYGEADVRFAKYPFPTLYKQHLLEAASIAKGVSGAKLAAARMEKRLRNHTEDYVTFEAEYEISQLTDFLSRLPARMTSDHMRDDLERFNRVRRANIFDVHELRAALYEYLPHKASVRGDSPIAIAERELIGKKLPGFFPTPKSTISDMLDHADIEAHHSVLEPNAGKGDIVEAIAERVPGVAIKAIEFNRTLSDVLGAKGIEVEFSDFLEHKASYDRIVMNPPFENGADIEHVQHAYSLLEPGGRMVAIMSEGPFFRSDKKAEAFRAWLDDNAGTSEQLPEDTFKGVDSFRHTGVRTRLVVIDR
ncbi:methyltransferase [Rubripirellula reticaptiva]|nr:methyltransferase [Rubripirellula reticaptiva]